MSVCGSVRAAGVVRVVHVIEATEGGTRRWVEDVLCGLDPARVANSCIYAARRDASFRDAAAAFCQRGIETWAVDMTRAPHPYLDAMAAMRIGAIVNQRRFDIVHAHSSKAGALARIAVGRAKRTLAVVYTPHAFAFLDGSVFAPFYRAVEKALRFRTDYVVAVSESERAHALSIGYGSERVKVIPNGVTIPPARRGRRNSGAHIGFIGNLRRQKDPQTFVAACGIVRTVRPEARFTVCGRGPMLRECREIAADVGLDGAIRFTGWIDDPRRVLDDVDVFVSCSRYEGLSFALLDAMAAGLPVVATRAPGNEEVVRHEHTGLLAPRGDPVAVAEAILRIVGDGAFASALGEGGRRYVAENHSLRAQLERLTRFYEGVAGERRGCGDR